MPRNAGFSYQSYSEVVSDLSYSDLMSHRPLSHKLVIGGVADKIGCRAKAQLLPIGFDMCSQSDAQFQLLRDQETVRPFANKERTSSSHGKGFVRPYDRGALNGGRAFLEAVPSPPDVGQNGPDGIVQFPESLR